MHVVTMVSHGHTFISTAKEFGIAFAGCEAALKEWQRELEEEAGVTS